MNKAVICLGSNTPDKRQKIGTALAILGEKCTLERWSGIYEYPALNGRDADYVNVVAEIATALSLAEMIELSKNTEKTLGRTPDSKRLGVIQIDIDVVEWCGEVVREKEHKLPYFTHGLLLIGRQ